MSSSDTEKSSASLQQDGSLHCMRAKLLRYVHAQLLPYPKHRTKGCCILRNICTRRTTDKKMLCWIVFPSVPWSCGRIYSGGAILWMKSGMLSFRQSALGKLSCQRRCLLSNHYLILFSIFSSNYQVGSRHDNDREMRNDKQWGWK